LVSGKLGSTNLVSNKKSSNTCILWNSNRAAHRILLNSDELGSFMHKRISFCCQVSAHKETLPPEVQKEITDTNIQDKNMKARNSDFIMSFKLFVKIY